VLSDFWTSFSEATLIVFKKKVYLKICKTNVFNYHLFVICLWSQKCTAAFIRQFSACSRW